MHVVNKTIIANLSKLLWTLITIQLLWTLFVTVNHVLFNSSLRLWLNNDYFWFQKLQYVLGYDYQLSLNMGNIPQDAGILVVSSNDLWFLNYYALPRRLYTYPGLKNDIEAKKVPDSWLKEKKIDYILLYHPPAVRLLKPEERWGIK